MHKRTRQILLGSYALTLLALAFPHVHARLDPRNQGFPLYYGSDSSHYVVRLEQGLVEPLSDTSNGIFSVPNAPGGLQPGGLEQIVGYLFSWTGWTATTVMVLLSTLFGATLVPLLQRLLVRTGLSDVKALGGSALYFFLFLGPIQRFVHSSWSLPLALLSLLLVWRFWDRPTVLRAICAGIIVGCLPHVYYWGWTFVWCTVGLLTLFSLFRSSSEKRARIIGLLCLWMVAAFIAIPYFLHIASMLGNSLANEVAERSSVVFSRGIESYPRSILTLLVALFALICFGRKSSKTREALIPVAALCMTSFIVLHQQLLHGKVISFSTHYYPYICIAALLFGAALFAHRAWSLHRIFSACLCVVFLGAAFVDYSMRYKIFMVDSDLFHYQHFSTVLPILEKNPRKEVILTDYLAGLPIAASTKHDVVFTEHARHLLISTREYAERYCLTDMFNPVTDPVWLPNMLHELSRLGTVRAEELRSERLGITTDACLDIRSNPKGFLKDYGVTLLLWDEKDHPEWKIDHSLFQLETQGQGWSLWRPVY